MTERDTFIRAIAENLYDDTPRLEFADWIDEHGEHDRAEFIRVQCELEPIRDKYEIPRAAELHELENKLGSQENVWLGEMPENWNDWKTGLEIEFRRGFPDILSLPARTFLELGETIRELHPTIRRVVLFCVNGWGERLAACPALRGLAELELACWYSDTDARALAGSRHLADLKILELWLSRRSEAGTDENLCRIAAESKAWPKLRELVLLDPEGESETRIAPLVAAVNRAAGREIGRYERGYPELFPLNSAFYYDFPIAGRLPDGRAAVVDLDCGLNTHRDSLPLGLTVTTFDDTGAPTGEVIRVPLPPELATVKRGDAKNWDGTYTKHAQAALGFEPGFIRVKAYALGDDFGPRRGHYDNWDLCGIPDDPENPTDRNGDPDPNGFGGKITWLIRDGQFVVGWDAWADKRGEVHST